MSNKKKTKSGLPGMTQAQAHAAHKATRTREIELVRSTARKMLSQPFLFVGSSDIAARNPCTARGGQSPCVTQIWQ